MMSDEHTLPVMIGAGDPFDWEAYIANYQGRTKIQRLTYIASRSPPLRIATAEAAAELYKNLTADVSGYQHAMLLRNTNPDPGQSLLPATQRASVDSAWIKGTQDRAKVKMERLELELRQYTNNLIKESIRMAHRDLGHHARYCGDLTTAYTCFTKTRDFCTTSEAVMEMCLNSIDICIELGRWSDILTYVGKAESQLDTYNPLAAGSMAAASAARAAASASRYGAGAGTSTGGVAARGGNTAGGDAIGALFRAGMRGDTTGGGVDGAGAGGAAGAGTTGGEKAKAKREMSLLSARLKAAHALALFRLERFPLAAKAFLDCDANAAEAYSEFISPGDIALYGVLCSLASFGRAELKSVVLERSSFQSFLEYEPHAREMLDSFASCRYQKVLDVLNKWQTRHNLDLHLSPVIAKLKLSLIRRAICQFVEPYDSVRVDRVSEAFGWDTVRTQIALTELVRTGEIRARIDTVGGVLEVDRVDERAELFGRAIKVGSEQTNKSRKMMFRMNLVREGLIVKEGKDEPLDFAY
ncbi:unnamed protein product [Tilletia laevis]|uniref:PCI domain-containing protein n=2 Tax=Tilletia TaxID=13289 RepID=A0A177V6I1_9BASI|nr:hypothetical protein CF336_g3658 [Tilletia laevis]KAE8260011.1 hypothetical protein A4X03_0g3935 [Tilletia caries]CAD6977643.1 unnamed protein product [Tilletia controversa]CAD6892517.1 unnamed protein product [Tilletia caries]CAD6961503.1 unnamed protein product [Tilletia laevis]